MNAKDVILLSALGGAGVYLYSKKDKIGSLLGGIGGGVTDVVGGITSGVDGAVKGVTDVVGGITSGVDGAVKGVTDFFGSLLGGSDTSKVEETTVEAPTFTDTDVAASSVASNITRITGGSASSSTKAKAQSVSDAYDAGVAAGIKYDPMSEIIAKTAKNLLTK